MKAVVAGAVGGEANLTHFWPWPTRSLDTHPPGVQGRAREGASIRKGSPRLGGSPYSSGCRMWYIRPSTVDQGHDGLRGQCG